MILAWRRAFTGGRLQSIDALRGIAALGVVLYHAVQQLPNPVPENLLKWPSMVIQFLSSFGYTGVFLFFVISGFCIHLQWARANSTGAPEPIHFRSFWTRRIRRLYPPYLIAFAAYLLLAASKGEIAVTPFFIYDVVMHVLMLHNLDASVCYSINGVFWTLAVEEQLYLAYFLLLFLRVRWGWGVTLTVCLLSRVGWYFLAQLIANKTGLNLPVSEAAAAHWFTWALGALSVEAFFGQLRLPAWSRNAWLGGSLLVLGIAMSLLLPSIHNLVLHDLVWLFLHPVWGAGFFVLVNRAILAEKTWSSKLSTPRIVRVLAIVGLISYSLYLTHELVIMQSWRFGTWVHFPLLNALIVIVPLTILAAFLFFLLFERPYIRRASAQPAPPLPQPQPELFAQAVNQVEA